jgi:RNA polymerase sigma-70 factor (ECF subfamily)
MDTADQQLMTLLSHCGSGNEKALEVIYRRLSPFLNRYAFAIVRCEALSSEVMQESFIQIWENSAQYCEQRGKPLTWICTIVRNRAIDKIRVEKKHQRFSHSEKEFVDVEQLPGKRQPELELVHKQSMLTFNRHLAELPENVQRCITLAYLHGYSRKELAVLLGTNVNTVKSWLHRGMRHIQSYEKYPTSVQKSKTNGPQYNTEFASNSKIATAIGF